MNNSTFRKTRLGTCTMRSTWDDVPDDLLCLLSQRLSGLAAFVRFGAVCRYWHSFTLANDCYKPVPWLLLSEKEGTDIREFFDISTGEVYEFPLPQTRGRKIAASAHGWLMTAGKDSRFHLLNPLNGIQIELPPLQTFQDVPDFCFYIPCFTNPNPVVSLQPLHSNACQYIYTNTLPSTSYQFDRFFFTSVAKDSFPSTLLPTLLHGRHGDDDLQVMKMESKWNWYGWKQGRTFLLGCSSRKVGRE